MAPKAGGKSDNLAISTPDDQWKLELSSLLDGTGSEMRNSMYCKCICIPRGGGVLPYMGYIGMCGPKGFGFSAVLVINWVSIFAL